MNRSIRLLFGGILIGCVAVLFVVVSMEYMTASSPQLLARTAANADLEYIDQGPANSTAANADLEYIDQGPANSLNEHEDEEEPAKRIQEAHETEQEGNAEQIEEEAHETEPQQEDILTYVRESQQTEEPQQIMSSNREENYPDWWRKSWTNSEVSKYADQFVGDKPLFPACRHGRKGVTTYGFIEPYNYIPNSKNPCWYEQPGAKRGLKCLPYVYLAGVAKCGTSDITKRLRFHPQVFYGTQKEYHWWERYRFGYYDEDDPESTIDLHDNSGRTFKEYLEDITGKDLLELQRELQVTGRSERIFGDFSPSYFWEPKNWYAIDGNQGCPEPRIIVAQHIYRVYPAAKIMMIFRHPTPRLYSRFMSRIHRTSYLKKATTADFHRWVVEGVQIYNDCFKVHSVRRCAYNSTLYRNVMVRLVEGMYPVFMADWLRVWPREQMLLMRYEDYAGREAEHMERIFNFLGLEPLDKEQMARVMKPDVVNAGTAEYEKYGGMLPETKKVLDEFYRPFVQQFRDLLGDDRFLWKDVYQ